MLQWNKLIRKIKISLFDVDKTNADRGTPRPDSHDQLAQDATKAHGTTSFNPVTSASDSTATAALTGILKVVWQISDTQVAPIEPGATSVTYTHNLNQPFIVFASGYYINDIATQYITAINDNASSSLGILNVDANSFQVSYSATSVSATTSYTVTFKVAIFAH